MSKPMNLSIYPLGDPHLGREFCKGVAPARRGEREAMIRCDFVRQLNPNGAEIHICMGDLFNEVKVSYETVMAAFLAYADASMKYPKTKFMILQGNHDKSRDSTVVAAWDIFRVMVHPLKNVCCVVEPKSHGRYGFLPWHPTKTAAEQLAALGDCREKGIDVLFGHWDTDPRTESHNLIPTEAMAEEGILVAYTGHIHKPDTFVRHGVMVCVVGSMQPYAQGEDGGQCPLVQYRSFCINGLEDELIDNPKALQNACVRLVLEPGEPMPETIPECRSFDVQRLRPEAVEAKPVEDISTEGFDTSAAYARAMQDRAIIPEVKQQIDDRWLSTSISED